MLGYGSGFFNNALSSYYVLVVVRGMKGVQLQRFQKYLLGIPLLCAFTLAFAGIPYYAPAWVGCYIVPYPYNDSQEMMGFAVFPILLTSIISTSCQIRVYLKVRSQVRTSLKWKFSKGLSKLRLNGSQAKFGSKGNIAAKGRKEEKKEKGRNSFAILLSTNAESAVFWQSFFYLAAYYTCWPILVVGILHPTNPNFSFWAALAFIGPLQGFLNCLVFVRPRIMKWRRERIKARETRQKKKNGAKR